MDGVGKMMKNNGRGEMICAFRDSCRGFGLPISENYLEKVNKLRAAAREALLTSATDIVE